jgi:2-polyprenyl-3-methyl-5-hydroxy-6-metoxy-1,4-benzoquinol methylase
VNRLERLAYTLFRAPFGVGRSIPEARWDEEYRQGSWERLDSAAQLAHYAVIAGYVDHFLSPGMSILDVGCGHGRLYHFLRPLGPARYLGLDISSEAIAKAQALGSAGVCFEVADFQTWSPTDRFDAVIFNESIYYAQEPLVHLERYQQAIAPAGIMILSVAQSSLNWGVSRQIRRRFPARHSTALRNELGDAWEVSVVGAEVDGRQSTVNSAEPR